MATVPAVIITSFWLYRQISKSLDGDGGQKERSAPQQQQEDDQDVLINREIGITDASSSINRLLTNSTITIAYASTTGTCAAYASKLQSALCESKYDVQLIKVTDVDWWDELVNNEGAESGEGRAPVLLFILPTWTEGKLPPESQVIIDSLEEILSDWRVAPEPLRGKQPVRVGAFGCV